MKKLSILFATGLFAAVVMGGCKKNDQKGSAAPASAAAGGVAAGGATAGGATCATLGAKMAKDAEAKMPKDAPPEQKQMMSEMVTKMSAILVKSCTDDKWSQEAIECGVKSENPEEECGDLVTQEQKDNLDKAFEAAMGMDGGDEGTAAVTGDQAVTGSSGLPECDEYVATMETYLQCDKIPQATRDAAQQGIDAFKAGWGDIGALPDDVKKQAADGCKQAVDALRQGAAALGCPL